MNVFMIDQQERSEPRCEECGAPWAVAMPLQGDKRRCLSCARRAGWLLSNRKKGSLQMLVWEKVRGWWLRSLEEERTWTHPEEFASDGDPEPGVAALSGKVARVEAEMSAFQVWADDMVGRLCSLEREVRGDGEGSPVFFGPTAENLMSPAEVAEIVREELEAFKLRSNAKPPRRAAPARQKARA